MGDDPEGTFRIATRSRSRSPGHIPKALLGAMSEAELIKYAKGGSHDAYIELIDRHVNLALRVVISILRGWVKPGSLVAEAELVAGEALWEAVNQIGRYEERGRPFGAYVARIATNKAYDLRKKFDRLRVKDPLPEDDSLAREEAIPFEESVAFWLTLTEAAESLPAALREVFALWAWEDLDHEEMAARLGISAQAARTRLSRANARVRTFLSERDWRPSVAASNRPSKGNADENILSEAVQLECDQN